MGTLTIAAGFVLGVLFLVAGLGKLLAAERFATTLVLSGLVPPRLVRPVRVWLPVLELAAATLLLTGLLHPLGPALALALLAAFTIRAWPVVRATGADGAIRCSCFGTAGERLDGGLIGRNLVLLAYAVAALGVPPIPAAGWQTLADPAALGLVACLAAFPFVIAEIVGAWQAAARVDTVPGLDTGAAPGGTR